eukprot:5577825-Lingulodinium_polyedra.AAC.1
MGPPAPLGIHGRVRTNACRLRRNPAAECKTALRSAAVKRCPAKNRNASRNESQIWQKACG